jgi:hypothetical protein
LSRRWLTLGEEEEVWYKRLVLGVVLDGTEVVATYILSMTMAEAPPPPLQIDATPMRASWT